MWYIYIVRAFKYTKFSKYAKKEGISDDDLWGVVDQLEEDQADANLGGDVFKVRIARKGEGKSGGHRAIIFFKSKNRTFFVYCFPKSERSNISDKELRAHKLDAKKRFLLTDEQINARIKEGIFIEIFRKEKK